MSECLCVHRWFSSIRHPWVSQARPLYLTDLKCHISCLVTIPLFFGSFAWLVLLLVHYLHVVFVIEFTWTHCLWSSSRKELVIHAHTTGYRHVQLCLHRLWVMEAFDLNDLPHRHTTNIIIASCIDIYYSWLSLTHTKKKTNQNVDLRVLIAVIPTQMFWETLCDTVKSNEWVEGGVLWGSCLICLSTSKQRIWVYFSIRMSS